MRMVVVDMGKKEEEQKEAKEQEEEETREKEGRQRGQNWYTQSTTWNDRKKY